MTDNNGQSMGRHVCSFMAHSDSPFQLNGYTGMFYILHRL
jgi:hypothetical protein